MIEERRGSADPSLVGRAGERAGLAERIEAAVQSRGSVALLAGESGVGKSRLIEQMRRDARAAGVTFLTGQCLEFAQAPYAPFARVLQTAIADYEGAAPPATHLRNALRSLVPTLSHAATDIAASEQLLKQWMFEAVLETFGRFSAKSPLVVAIEDLHWADASTLDLLRYVAASIADLRLCLVLSYRPEAVGRRHALNAALGELERQQNVFRIPVRPLVTTDALALVDNAAGKHPLSAQARRHICTLAQGNPLFLEELAKFALQAGDLGDVILPPSLEHTVLARLSNLSDVEFEALEIAAVVGITFDAKAVAQLAGVDERTTSRMLRAVRDLGIVRTDTTQIGAFVFQHELTRQIIYNHALPTTVRAIHERIASSIEESALISSRAPELSYRWRAAGDARKATTYAEVAGDESAQLHAYEDAVAEYELALHDSDVPPGTRARIETKVARLHYLMGSSEVAAAYYDQAIRRFEEIGDEPTVGRLRLRYAGSLARAARLPDAVQECEKVIPIAEQIEDQQLLHDALTMLAQYYMLQNDAARAKPLLDRADVLPPSDPTMAATRLQTRSVVHFLEGDLEAWRATAPAAIEAAEAAGDPDTLVTCWYNVAAVAFEVGEREMAETLFERAIKFGDEISLLGSTAYGRIAYGYVCIESGRLSEARDALLHVLHAASTTPVVRIGVAQLGIYLAILTGDDGLLERCDDPTLIELAEGSGEGNRFGPLAAAYAWLLDSRGDRNGAAALLARCMAMTVDAWFNHQLLLTVAILGHTSDADKAVGLLRDAVAVRPNDRSYGYLYLAEAYVAARARNRREASQRANAAIVYLERIGAAPLVAACYQLLDKTEKAAEIYQAIGAWKSLQRVSGTETSEDLQPKLSRREAEIVELIASGMSNRALADRLSISERTVEHHLSSIYRKLGLTSRLDLILYARDRTFRDAAL